MENVYATASSQFSSQISSQDFASLRDFVYSQASSNYSNLISKLDFTTNLILGIFTILSVIMGFLVWKNYKLNEEFETTLIRTKNYLEEKTKEAYNLLNTIKDYEDQSKSILEKLKNYKKEVDEIKNLPESRKPPIHGKLTNLSRQINNDISSFKTISQIDMARSALKDILDSDMQKNENPNPFKNYYSDRNKTKK